MDSFRQPLLNREVFVLTPEPLHLIGSSLGYQILVLDLLPKRRLVQILRVVTRHDLEKLDSLNNSKLFLLSDVQFLAGLLGALR